MYVRFPDDYRRARSSFIVLNGLAILCFALFSLTPPRLMSQLGYVDTVAKDSMFGSWGTPLVSAANQHAAIPSLQLAWALWVSVVLAWLARGLAVQIVSAVHVAVTFFVIVATANHFAVDAIAAIPFVWAAVAVVDWRRSRPMPMSSADAFFLHVETDSAPQHVGGMVVLARGGPGVPALDEIRALVRDELLNMPRFRQRPEQSPIRRRWRWVEVDTRDMDWEWHVSERAALPGSTDDDIESASVALCRTVADVATERMPRDRPMWRMVFVREITPGRTGFLFMVHHCVADGIGTVAHALNILRPRLDLPADSRPPPGGIKKAVETVVGLAQLATDGRPEARLPAGSPLRGFAAAGFDLDTVRSVARVQGARVTDLVLSLLATAVDRTHPEFAAAVGHRLRVSVPIMLREPGSAAEGNVTAAAMIDLPLAGMNANDRFVAICKSSAGLRTPTRALASRFVMTDVLAVVPNPVARWFARAVYGPAFVQGIVSNMPGPTERMSIAGVPFERVVPILPLAPGAPLALGALSWSGVLAIGLTVDSRFLDADSLVAAMAEALRELVGDRSAAHRTGEMPGRHGRRFRS